jgi:hypothetical protein
VNTDPNAVRDLFASHYFIFAFLASLGTLQIAVSNSGIRGLWLTPHRGMTRWLGVALIITGIVIFFLQPMWVEGPWAAGSVEADSITREIGTASWSELAGARNVNDIHGGLDGNKQAKWFPLAAILAFAVSALIGTVNVKTLRNLELSSPSDSPTAAATPATDDGLAGLTNRPYLANLLISFRNFKADIPKVWRTGLDSADRWSLFKMIFGRNSN